MVDGGVNPLAPQGLSNIFSPQGASAQQDIHHATVFFTVETVFFPRLGFDSVRGRGLNDFMVF